MNRTRVLVCAISVAVLLTGCGPEGANKTTIGTLGGAVIGGLAGSAFGSGSGRMASVAAGTLLGGWLGHSIGVSLDKADLAYHQQAYDVAIEQNKSGVTSTWYNPDSGHSGSVTPRYTYTNPAGQYCREYTQTIKVGSEVQRGYGKACRMPDGTWQIMNSNHAPHH